MGWDGESGRETEREKERKRETDRRKRIIDI